MQNRLRYNVLLLNDDQTPMEFVVLVLERFVDMDYDDACRHMLCVHENGMAICGTYFRNEAEQKVADVLSFAGEHKHPLKCTLEEAN
jgi:ATP-dependent Clp protease adaptor protein ClpS